MDLDKFFSKVEKLLDEVLDPPKAGTYSSRTTWTDATAATTPKPRPEPRKVQFIRSELEFVFDTAMVGANAATQKYLRELRKKYLGN